MEKKQVPINDYVNLIITANLMPLEEEGSNAVRYKMSFLPWRSATVTKTNHELKIINVETRIPSVEPLLLELMTSQHHVLVFCHMEMVMGILEDYCSRFLLGEGSMQDNLPDSWSHINLAPGDSFEKFFNTEEQERDISCSEVPAIGDEAIHKKNNEAKNHRKICQKYSWHNQIRHVVHSESAVHE